MNAKLGIGIAAAGVAALALAWLVLTLPHGSDVSTLSSEPSSSPALETADAHATVASSSEEAGARAPITGSVPAPASAVKPTPAPDIDGLVIDVRGEPVPDVEVQFRTAAVPTEGPKAPSDTAGVFHLPPSGTKGWIVIVSEPWATVLSPQVKHPYDGERLVLVVAPRISLEGVVLDEHRNPVPAARVFHVTPDLRTRLDFVLDSSATTAANTLSDAHGRFHLAELPSIEGSSLQTTDDMLRYRDDVREAPCTSRSDLEIVLKPLDPRLRIRGRVVDAHQAGIEGAWVALDRNCVRTDGDGRFLFDLQYIDPGRKLRALKKGLLPVELECATPSPRDPGAWPDPLLLVLDREALAISGRVVDASGGAVTGARVQLLDRTPFGKVYAAGDPPAGTSPSWGPEDVEPLLAGQPFSFESVSGADGRFEVPGLLPQAYRLLAFDPATCALHVTEPVRAGTSGFEIALPGTGHIARLAGRVVDRRGRPVEGALVKPSRPLPKLPDFGMPNLSGEPAHTDTLGRFEFLGLPQDVDRLIVSVDPSPEKTEFRIADAKDPEAIEILVARPCHMRVDLTGSSIEAGSFEVQDARGDSIPIISRQGNISIGFMASSRTGDRRKRYPLQLHKGRSEAFAVSESARMLILYGEGKEVAHIELNLTPDQLNVIRP